MRVNGYQARRDTWGGWRSPATRRRWRSRVRRRAASGSWDIHLHQAKVKRQVTGEGHDRHPEMTVDQDSGNFGPGQERQAFTVSGGFDRHPADQRVASDWGGAAGAAAILAHLPSVGAAFKGGRESYTARARRCSSGARHTRPLDVTLSRASVRAPTHVRRDDARDADHCHRDSCGHAQAAPALATSRLLDHALLEVRRRRQLSRGTRALRKRCCHRLAAIEAVRWRSSRMRASSAFRPPPATTTHALPSRLAVIGPCEARPPAPL